MMISIDPFGFWSDRLTIDLNAEFTSLAPDATVTLLTCSHCGKQHAALDFSKAGDDTWEATCPETGETIRLRLTAEQKRPGPSEFKREAEHGA
jgi:hypothetical protein